ncbi:hypothetical protein [Prochlorococcus marinus]|uniref:hypothetical protein n=1 Tax=Prochlorococcus marinus TaxID=1219 RepID=UPI0007B33E7A|nr:hypothetical protein [Prochlorococcus marinus]KZR78471.1 hypothetical protein PMIT1320_00067 [Prochlorococcus marinus str. MIT 1320]
MARNVRIKSCAQPEKKGVEACIAECQDNGEASEPSDGQVFVINKITGEKPLPALEDAMG